jgi:hypothetical protein
MAGMTDLRFTGSPKVKSAFAVLPVVIRKANTISKHILGFILQFIFGLL